MFVSFKYNARDISLPLNMTAVPLVFQINVPNALQKHPPDLVENALRNSRREAVKYKTLFEPVVGELCSRSISASLFYISVT